MNSISEEPDRGSGESARLADPRQQRLRAGARRRVGFGRPAPSARVSDAARIVRAGLAGAGILPRWMNVDRSPPPVSLTAALALPRTQDARQRCSSTAISKLRFAARPTNGPQIPHQRDEFYARSFPSADRKSGRDRGGGDEG